MLDSEAARFILESLACELGALPVCVWDDALTAACNPAIVHGLRAARDALLEHVTENDVQQLSDHIHAEIRDGLRALQKS